MNLCPHENVTAGKYCGRCNDCGAEGKLFRKIQIRDYEELPRCMYPVEGKPCGVYAPKGQDYCGEHALRLVDDVGWRCCSPDNPCWA